MRNIIRIGFFMAAFCVLFPLLVEYVIVDLVLVVSDLLSSIGTLF